MANELHRKISHTLKEGRQLSVDDTALYGSVWQKNKACTWMLNILYHIYKTNTYFYGDPVFYAVDDRFNDFMHEMKRDGPSHSNRDRNGEKKYTLLQIKYIQLLKKLKPYEKAFYRGLALRLRKNGDEEEDDDGTSDDALRHIEKGYLFD